MAHISLSITVNSNGAAKPMLRQTPLGWKLRKANPVCIHSSAQIAKETIRWTQINARFRGTDSTESGIKENMLKFGTTKQSQFVLK